MEFFPCQLPFGFSRKSGNPFAAPGLFFSLNTFDPTFSPVVEEILRFSLLSGEDLGEMEPLAGGYLAFFPFSFRSERDVVTLLPSLHVLWRP